MCRSEDSALTFGRHLERGGGEAKGPGARGVEVKTFRGHGLFRAIKGTVEGGEEEWGLR